MKTRGQERYNEHSGSLKRSEPEFFVIGKIRKPFGLTGEMKIAVFIDKLDPFKPGEEIFTGVTHFPRNVTTFRKLGKDFAIRLSGINTPEDAHLLINQPISIKSKQLPELDEDSYYQYQLLGMRVIDEKGYEIGLLKEILATGANDVYVIIDQKTGQELLFPAIKSVVKKIDIESRLITIEKPEWLD